YILEVKRTRGLRLPLTRVSFVESKVNEDELAEFIAYWKDRVDFLTIQQFFNFFAGRKEATTVEKTFRIRRDQTAGKQAVDPLMVKCTQPDYRLSARTAGHAFAAYSD